VDASLTACRRQRPRLRVLRLRSACVRERSRAPPYSPRTRPDAHDARARARAPKPPLRPLPGERRPRRARYGSGPVTGKKTPGGAGTHARDTRDTRTHKGTQTTQTNLTTIQTQFQQHTPSTSARRPKPRPTQHPQARSRPLPAADSEEAAPSEPDPASTCSQSASQRLLESGRRNEGACGRRVAAGSAAGARYRYVSPIGVFLSYLRPFVDFVPAQLP
jgi:hypothetical protein